MRVKAGHFAAKKRNRPILKLSKCIIRAITNSVECGRSVRKLLTSQLIGHNHQHRQYTREPYRLVYVYTCVITAVKIYRVHSWIHRSNLHSHCHHHTHNMLGYIFRCTDTGTHHTCILQHITSHDHSIRNTGFATGDQFEPTNTASRTVRDHTSSL